MDPKLQALFDQVESATNKATTRVDQNVLDQQLISDEVTSITSRNNLDMMEKALQAGIAIEEDERTKELRADEVRFDARRQAGLDVAAARMDPQIEASQVRLEDMLSKINKPATNPLDWVWQKLTHPTYKDLESELGVLEAANKVSTLAAQTATTVGQAELLMLPVAKSEAAAQGQLSLSQMKLQSELEADRLRGLEHKSSVLNRVTDGVQRSADQYRANLSVYLTAVKEKDELEINKYRLASAQMGNEFQRLQLQEAKDNEAFDTKIREGLGYSEDQWYAIKKDPNYYEQTLKLHLGQYELPAVTDVVGNKTRAQLMRDRGPTIITRNFMPEVIGLRPQRAIQSQQLENQIVALNKKRGGNILTTEKTAIDTQIAELERQRSVLSEGGNDENDGLERIQIYRNGKNNSVVGHAMDMLVNRPGMAVSQEIIGSNPVVSGFVASAQPGVKVLKAIQDRIKNKAINQSDELTISNYAQLGKPEEVWSYMAMAAAATVAETDWARNGFTREPQPQIEIETKEFNPATQSVEAKRINIRSFEQLRKAMVADKAADEQMVKALNARMAAETPLARTQQATPGRNTPSFQ